MKKVGICACCDGNNYGTILQTFVTLTIIQRLGYSCEIIKYRKKYSLVFSFKQFLRIMNGITIKAFFRKRILKMINMMVHRSYSNGLKLRRKEISKFKNDNFGNKCQVYYGYNTLCAGSKKYMSVVVGSDQLWLPSGLSTNFYNLIFVDESIPKISYATSFGVSKIPFYQKKKTKHFLERFHAISVREISGKKIINSLTDKKVDIVLDPTLLLTEEEWKQEIPENRVVSGSYIFCYFLGKNKECRKAANELKSMTGLKIVTLKHLDEYIAMDEEFGDEAPYNISPRDFINLIRYADYVLTDSFHGTVFSILHHKQFKTFYRFKPKSSHSRNSRIDSLFTLLGLQDRLYRHSNIFEEVNQKIDYYEVDKRLADLRNHSMNFLRNALKLGEMHDHN